MFAAQSAALEQYRAPPCDKCPWTVDYYSITRELIRSGLDLNDTLLFVVNSWRLFQEEEQPFLEDPSKPLLDWAAFLLDQGLMVDLLGMTCSTVWIPYLLLRGKDERDIRRCKNVVYLLCLLKADVSIREPKYGLQALHILFGNEWSAELSPHVTHLAYILVHFGGADVHAVGYKNRTPTIYAFITGWIKEWQIVLDHCGFDFHEVVIKDIEFREKSRFLGNGESTAIDTEDLSIPNSVSSSSRRRVVSARLDE